MTTYVYRAFDAAGKLLYIGQSRNPESRKCDHMRSAAWASRVSRWELEGPMSAKAAIVREAEAILREQPEFNSRHKEHGPASRPRVEPPLLSIADLRAACGLTLDEVCARFEDETGERLTRGALSAIELGHRGASRETLRGLESAFRIRRGALTTSYSPRIARSAA